MFNLILFGPPGSGKGTQAAFLVEKFGFIHLSTGDIFRKEIGNNTELGSKAKEYISKGELVPDSITIGMLKKSMESIDNPVGFIFDGFPRTINQSEALDDLLSELGAEVNTLIRLEVSDQEIIDRIKIRAETSGRPDDADETIIKNRISVYQSETQPVYKYYQDKGKAISMDGTGTLEEISIRLSTQIEKVFQQV